MKRIIFTAEAVVARHFAGKVQFKYLVSSLSNLLQRVLSKDRNIRNTTQHTSQFGRRLVYENNQNLNYWVAFCYNSELEQGRCIIWKKILDDLLQSASVKWSQYGQLVSTVKLGN